DLEVALRHQLLQPLILVLQLAQHPDVRGFQAPEPLAPGVDSLLTHSVALRYIGDRRTIRLAQDLHHLLFAEPALLHGFLSSPEAIFAGFKPAENRLAGQSEQRIHLSEPKAVVSTLWVLPLGW